VYLLALLPTGWVSKLPAEDARVDRTVVVDIHDFQAMSAFLGALAGLEAGVASLLG